MESAPFGSKRQNKFFGAFLGVKKKVVSAIGPITGAGQEYNRRRLIRSYNYRPTSLLKI